MEMSEASDIMLQSQGVATNEVMANEKMEIWPQELEICIEYCTRNVFHARYDADKYMVYFQSVSDAFLARSAQTKIVGNPFTGKRRIWKAFDKYGPLTEDVDLPRLGAFEVTVNSEATGCVTIFSKLDTRRWPNPRILTVQVDRLLRKEPLLQPLPSQSPRNDESRSPRKQSPRVIEYGLPATNLSSTDLASTKSVTSQASTARSPCSPEREKAAPSAPAPRMSSKKSDTGNKKDGSGGQGSPKASVDSTGVDEAARLRATSNEEVEDAQYGGDDFEGEESGDGSSCFGAKVWMPGAAKEEKWENEEEANRKVEEKLRAARAAEACAEAPLEPAPLAVAGGWPGAPEGAPDENIAEAVGAASPELEA